MRPPLPRMLRWSVPWRPAARDHDGPGVADVGGHDRAGPRGVAGAQRRRRSRRWWAEAAAQRRLVVGVEVAPHDRRVDRRRPARWPASGASARATSRSWKARFSGTRASRSCVGPGLPTSSIRCASSSSSATSSRGGVRDGEAGQLRLQRGAQVEDALELGDGPGGDAGAAVGDDLDQALGGQPAQRLADRGAADAEALGELDLAQPGPGRQVARRRISSRSACSARSADVRDRVTRHTPWQIVCNLGPSRFRGATVRRTFRATAYKRGPIVADLLSDGRTPRAPPAGADRRGPRRWSPPAPTTR